MDFEPEGTQESLIPSLQEKTARRTNHLLVATRLAFAFAHGALVVSASVALGWEADASWWAVFLPAWLGDALCVVLIVLSWFASCPYIQLCLNERQARLGDSNPSILTEILPDIVMSILGLIFVVLALAAEIMLCRYLDHGRLGEPRSLVPSAVVFVVVSMLACCRGVCIRSSGELFVFLGAGALLTSVAATTVPGGATGQDSWVLVLPLTAATAGLLVACWRRLRLCTMVLTREERLLRLAEQFVILAVLIALLALSLVLAVARGLQGGSRGAAAVSSGVAGLGVCIISALRARMAMVESRLCTVRERLVSLAASGARGQSDAFGVASCGGEVCRREAVAPPA